MTRTLRRLFLAVLVLAGVCSTAQSATYYVRSNGNDSKSGTSASNAWKTLSKVSQQTLSLGDIVYVGAGTYDGTVLFNKMSNSSSSSGSNSGSSGSNSGSGNSGNGSSNSNAGGNSNGNGNSGSSNAGGNSGSGNSGNGNGNSGSGSSNSGNGNGNSGSSNSTIQLVAVVNGSNTGDRGDVILRGAAGNYALQFEGLNRWVISGFKFQTLNTSQRGYGVYVSKGCTNMTFSGCVFDSLVTGIVAYSTAANGSYPTCTYNATSCSFLNGTSWDVLNYDYSEFTATSCSFQHSSGQQGGVYSSTQGDLTLTSCTFTNSNYGVYGNDADDIIVTSNSFDTVNFPLYGSCDTATITSCQTAHATYGCYLNADVSPASISNCTFANGTYGVLVASYGATMGTLTLSDNVVGLWVDARVPSFTLTSSQNVQFVRNQTGIYIEQRTDGSRPQITLDSLSLSDCSNFGVLAYTGDITIRNCRFDRVSSSVYIQSNAKTASVRNCSFNSSSTNWTVYSEIPSLTVRDCSFANCTYGIQLNPSTTSTPDLANLSFTNGTYAVVAYNSNVNVTQNTNVSFNNAYLGWYLLNSQCNFQKSTITGASYPVYISGGTLAMTDTTVSGGVYDVYATGFTNCSLTRCSIQGATSWGSYLSGQNVSLSDTTITSNANGLYVQDTNATTRSAVTNLVVEKNTGWGAAWISSDFALNAANKQTAFRNNGYGLGYFSKDLNLTSTTGLDISGNTVGIYMNRGNVSLSGVSIGSNVYGLQHYYGALTCSNSTINGGEIGIYHVDGPSIDVSKTTFSGNSNCGLYVANSDATILKQPISVRDSTFASNGSGAVISPLADAAVSVTRCSMQSGSSHGLVLYRAPASLTNSTISSNQGYGVLTYDVALTATDNTIDSIGGYGIYAALWQTPNAASVIARRNLMRKNAYGIGTSQVVAVEVSNNVVTGGTYGLVVNSTKGVMELWNNTLVDNYIGLYPTGGTARAKNNIVAYGDLNAGKQNSYGIYRVGGTLDASNNLLFGQSNKYYGTTRGAGDVIKPPRFVDRANGNYQLAMGSPAINAGADSGGLITTDMVLNARPAFRALEIGAYEYTGKSGSVRVLDWKEAAKTKK